MKSIYWLVELPFIIWYLFIRKNTKLVVLNKSMDLSELRRGDTLTLVMPQEGKDSIKSPKLEVLFIGFQNRVYCRLYNERNAIR